MSDSILVQESSPPGTVELTSPGPQGPSGTFTIGTITTGLPGTAANITNTGTPSQAVLNFTIPRGDVGDITPALTAAKVAAEAAATAAGGSATTATTQANISTTQASTATAQANLATTKASEAVTAASAALASQNAASTAATNATGQATSATTSATNAAASATTATTQAAEAVVSAASASGSASSATASASTATTKAAEASVAAATATSMVAAAEIAAASSLVHQQTAAEHSLDASTSADNANSSAISALASKNSAAASATAASGSATTATTQASNAASSAITASTKASEASAFASNAASSESAAAFSAASASTSKVAAEAAQASAATSANSALSSLNSFRGQYYGAFTSDPTLDPLGNARTEGDLYFNTTTKRLRVFGGTTWQDGHASSISVQVFSGNGSQSAFVLSPKPESLAHTQVYISGVYIPKSQYTLNASNLVFNAPVTAGTNNIEVVVMSVVLLGITEASLVNFNPAGTGAVPRTMESKNRESVSVLDFGADPIGLVDSTAAFSAAAKAAPAAVNIVGAEGTLPRAPMCQVLVPAGSFVLTSEVDTGNREVVWVLDQAAKITGFSFINGEIIRIGQRQADYHHGTTDYACGYSIRSNTNLEDGAEVLGITSASQLAVYGDRDSVGLYVDNAAPPATVDVGTASYTSTTVTISAPSVEKLRQYRRGMIIDTKHSPKWSGIVDSWNSNGSVLTVTGWYQFGGGGSAGTPPNDTGCVVNGFTKVWAHNANVFLNSGSHARQASGFELGVLNNRGVLDFANQTNYIWGFDAVNLGTYEGAVGFIARPGSAKFYRGFQCNDATQAAFYAAGTPGVGFWSEQTAGNPFRHTNGGATRFEVSQNGLVFSATGFSSSGVSSSLSLGATTSANTPFIDLNSSGNSVDYDVRLIASGGSVSAGSGTLQMLAGLVTTPGKVLVGGTSLTSGSAGPAMLEMQSTSQAAIMTARYGGSDSVAPIFQFIKDRTGSDVQNGDGLGQIRFEGSHTGSYRRGAMISVTVEGTPSATSMPGLFAIQVTKVGSTSPTSALIIQSSHHIATGTDNVQYLGTPSNRWAVVYAGSGTINTSDGREKQDIASLDEAEIRVAASLKGLIKKFRFKDAVQIKGEAARIHVGVIAQDVIAAFSAESLDATRYGIICYDEWEEQAEVLDDEGGVVQFYRPAGNRYGVRYEELLSFIIGGL